MHLIHFLYKCSHNTTSHMIMNLRKGYDNASLANKRNTQKFSKLIAKRLRKFSVVYCGGDTEKGRKAHLVSWDIFVIRSLMVVWDLRDHVIWMRLSLWKWCRTLYKTQINFGVEYFLANMVEIMISRFLVAHSLMTLLYG